MKKVILANEKDGSILSLHQMRVNFPTHLFDHARSELRGYELQSLSKDMWAYLPDYKQDKLHYPSCKRLCEAMLGFLTSIIDELKGVELSVSFLKLASAKPPKEWGGLHLDDRLGTEQSEGETRDILRVLVNLNHHPRFLSYSPLTGDELRARGVNIPVGEYSPITLPGEFFLETLEIPARKDDTISFATFIANKVPHVGITDENGYFLMGLGAYV